MDPIIPPQVESSHKTPSYKIIVGTFIVLILLISSFISGYLLHTKDNSPHNQQAVINKPSQPQYSISPSSTIDAIPTGWKTYKNANSDLTFQYPPNLLLDRDDQSSDISVISLTDNGFPKLTIYISARAKSDEHVADLAKILTTKKLQGFMYSNITIHSINSFELYSFNSEYGYFQEDIEAGKLPPTGGSLTNLEARGTLKDKFYEITYPYNPDTLTSDQRTFNMILSSVKLTK